MSSILSFPISIARGLARVVKLALLRAPLLAPASAPPAAPPVLTVPRTCPPRLPCCAVRPNVPSNHCPSLPPPGGMGKPLVRSPPLPSSSSTQSNCLRESPSPPTPPAPGSTPSPSAHAMSAGGLARQPRHSSSGQQVRGQQVWLCRAMCCRGLCRAMLQALPLARKALCGAGQRAPF